MIIQIVSINDVAFPIAPSTKPTFFLFAMDAIMNDAGSK